MFHASQYFATKLCNLTNFVMLFLALISINLALNLVYGYAECPYCSFETMHGVSLIDCTKKHINYVKESRPSCSDQNPDQPCGNKKT